MEKIFEIHDFSAKLQQKSVFSSLQNYYYNHTVLEASNSPNSIIELFSKTKKRFFSPLSINLDLTVGCNFRCPHCIDEDIINTKNKIDYNTLVKSLINLRIGGLQTVILIGGGEPTVYPEISNVVKVIKSLGMGCAIVTNGSRNHKILEIADYFDEKDWIRLSLDSGNDDTFQHLHKPVKKFR